MKNVEARKSALSEKDVLDECVQKPSACVRGRQSNHDDYYLPKCLAHLNNPPLYIAIAHWGLLKKTPFTRDDIAQAFRISPRRAADVMSYIQSARSDVITLIRRVTDDGRGVRHLTLQVTGVSEQAIAARPGRPAKRRHVDAEKRQERKQKSDEVKALRTWFLSRPTLSS